MSKKGTWAAFLSGAIVLFVFTLSLVHCGTTGAASAPPGKADNPDATQAVPAPFSKETNCAACHESYVGSVKDSRMLINKHSVMIKDCFFCHKEDDLVSKHEKVTGPPKKLFRQRKYPNDMCTSCHGSYDKLVEKTKDSTALKTVHDELINPHQTHVGQVECHNCHKMHKDRPPIEYCYGCHHPRQLSNCKDCHAPQKE